MEAADFIIDMDSEPQRHRLYKYLKDLKGKIRFEICKYRRRRTDAQNAYYWPCFVHPFGEFLRENNIQVDGRLATDDDAHDILKFKFLPSRSVVNQATGEVMEMRATTSTTLTTDEFNMYLDRCKEFLATYCGIIVPDPSEYFPGGSHSQKQIASMCHRAEERQSAA